MTEAYKFFVRVNYFTVQLSFISASISTSWVRIYLGFYCDILIYPFTQLIYIVKD